MREPMDSAWDESRNAKIQPAPTVVYLAPEHDTVSFDMHWRGLQVIRVSSACIHGSE